MKFTLQNASDYVRYYSDKDFVKKLKRIAIKVGSKVLLPALQLYYLMGSKEVPFKAKTLIIGALGYLILPIDLVPDILPMIGFTDDLSALVMVLHTLNKYLTPEINRQAKEQTERLMKAGS